MKEDDFILASSPLNWLENAKLMHTHALHAHELHKAKMIHIVDRKAGRMNNVTFRPVFLLAAFAFENMLKGFLIYENPELTSGGGLSKEITKGHNLVRLASKCKRTPSPKKSEAFFEKLQSGTNSWFRYPCPRNTSFENNEFDMTFGFWLDYQKLFNKYEKRLSHLLCSGWRDCHGRRYKATIDSERSVLRRI